VWANEKYINKIVDPTRQEGVLMKFLTEFYKNEFTAEARTQETQNLKSGSQGRENVRYMNEEDRYLSEKFSYGFFAALERDAVSNELPFNSDYARDILQRADFKFVRVNRNSVVGLQFYECLDNKDRTDVVIGGQVVPKLSNDGFFEVAGHFFENFFGDGVGKKEYAQEMAEVAVHETLGHLIMGGGEAMSDLITRRICCGINRQKGKISPYNEDVLECVYKNTENKAEFWASGMAGNLYFNRYVNDYFKQHPEDVCCFKKEYGSKADLRDMSYGYGMHHSKEEIESSFNPLAVTNNCAEGLIFEDRLAHTSKVLSKTNDTNVAFEK
jgi:hypothetical protein